MSSPDFLVRLGRLINAGQARSVVVTGNIHDLFELVVAGQPSSYVPLVELLARSWDLPGRIVVVYELNGPIRFLRESDRAKVKDAWLRWRTGRDANELAIASMLASGRVRGDLEAIAQAFDSNLAGAAGQPTLALELLRQMCLCARTQLGGRRLLAESLIIIIEGADLLAPEGPVRQLGDADRHRVTVLHDWFSDPGFSEGADAVVLLAESLSQVNERIARLPQVLEVNGAAPDLAARRAFIAAFRAGLSDGRSLALWSTEAELARFAAGLSLHALRQMLKGAVHEQRALQPQDVIDKVEAYIQTQLGDDIVEFKRPEHRLKDVIGFARLREFLGAEFIPRLRQGGAAALPGAAVCGPIGGGKTFIFEAVAAELDMVVLVLKNIRSQWFGQTDVIFERLRRVLEALDKVLIFMDEADTQMGGVGPEAHETERRLTGKIQQMMSDTRLRGRVTWLLMTARIHQLSPDMRRPGRVGDLIIPVLDPEGEDRWAFLAWMVEPALGRKPSDSELALLEGATRGWSSAQFASVRSELKARAAELQGDLEAVRKLIADRIPPAIAETRRYQTLQALVHCSRRSLLPDPAVTEETRAAWAAELRVLEARGLR